MAKREPGAAEQRAGRGEAVLLILLTNDDGVYADGIHAMRSALEGLEGVEVVVVAPDRERSASSHAITMHRPLFTDPVTFPGSNVQHIKVTGTPADCAKLAIEKLLERRPDLVISGVNRGSNLGTDVFYSGTVSAAIEATILGVPSIAVSLCTFKDPDYDFACRFARRLALKVADEGLPRATLLNVNVPAIDPERLAGVAVTRLGVRLYKDVFDRRVDPRGKVYYWLAGEAMELQNGGDTDVVAIANNCVSVTPIHLDLTRYDLIDRLQGWHLDHDLLGT